MKILGNRLATAVLTAVAMLTLTMSVATPASAAGLSDVSADLPDNLPKSVVLSPAEVADAVPLGRAELRAGADCGRVRMLRDRRVFLEDSSAIVEQFYRICTKPKAGPGNTKWVRNGQLTEYYNHLLDGDQTWCGPSLFRGFNFKNYYKDPYGRAVYKNHTLDCEDDTVGRRTTSMLNTTRLYFERSGIHPSTRPKWKANVTMKWDLGIPDETLEFRDFYHYKKN